MPFSKRTTADQVLAGLELAGRVFLVTGANAGIGFETARALAAAGARVYCGARTPQKAEDTVARLRGLHADADVRPFVVELGSLADCARAAADFPEPALHGLIANAGVYGGGFQATADGLERTVGVCHFGHAALIRGLMPLLEAAAHARVVMVSSESHRGERALDPERVSMTAAEYSDLGAYNRAKLCNVLYANAFDRRFRDRGLRANSLHPGTFVATDIGRSSLLAKLAMALYRPFSKGLPQAAATSVWAAAHPDLEGVGGEYLIDCAIGRASDAGRDEALADRLWATTEAALEHLAGR